VSAAEQLAQALAELVAVKDLKIKSDKLALDRHASFAEYDSTQREYLRRQPVAWVKARAALAAWEAEKAKGPTMNDAIAAVDGTLHGAIGYWQERALRAEKAAATPSAEPLTDAQLPLLPEPANGFVFAGLDWHRAERHYFEAAPEGEKIEAFSREQMREYARAALTARQPQAAEPLTDEQADAVIDAVLRTYPLHKTNVFSRDKVPVRRAINAALGV